MTESGSVSRLTFNASAESDTSLTTCVVVAVTSGRLLCTAERRLVAKLTPGRTVV